MVENKNEHQSEKYHKRPGDYVRRIANQKKGFCKDSNQRFEFQGTPLKIRCHACGHHCYVVPVNFLRQLHRTVHLILMVLKNSRPIQQKTRLYRFLNQAQYFYKKFVVYHLLCYTK